MNRLPGAAGVRAAAPGERLVSEGEDVMEFLVEF